MTFKINKKISYMLTLATLSFYCAMLNVADLHVKKIKKHSMNVSEFLRTAFLIACGFFLGCLFSQSLVYYGGKK